MAVSVKIDDELKSRLESLAQTNDRSPHWMMREAIRQYVDREEKRAAFLREAEEGWAHFKNTGKHLTLEEADDWLATWGTDKESTPPVSHT